VQRDQATAIDVKVGDTYLAVEISGDPEGAPVFLLHGMPGSRSGPKPRPGVLYRLGVQLITYDRPGYGDSPRRKDRVVSDAAVDVAAIAEQLQIPRFAVAGRSGGGPHALACAALRPDLVACAAAFVTLAPADAVGLDWFGGMANTNVVEFLTAGNGDPRFAARLRLKADRALSDPESMVAQLREEMTDPDKRAVGDVVMRRLLSQTYVQAFKDGSDGWVDDVVALRQDWGFRVEDIRRPVLLWHGETDNFAPVSHARWLQERIPGAEIHVQTGTSHFGAVDAMIETLPWLTQWHRKPTLTRPAPATLG
jgi:pimeloyl-ACP methyl ester carboxylesterase